MAPATTEVPEAAQQATFGGRVADAYRQATEVSHEARRLKSAAEQAMEDGLHAARRAVKSVRHRVEDLEDLKHEAIHRVKRRPLRAIGIAVGVGLVLGVVAGWLGARLGPNDANQ
jgi:ElaB/YqjD/DUF883 family membrane-anchored ribosome-binding protein